MRPLIFLGAKYNLGDMFVEETSPAIVEITLLIDFVVDGRTK